MLLNLNYKITFSIYRKYDDLIKQSKPNQTIIYDSKKIQGINCFGAPFTFGPSVTVNMTAKNFNMCYCNLQLYNLPPHDLVNLAKTKDEVLSTTGNKFIYLKIEATGIDNSLTYFFSGVVIESYVTYTTNTSTLSVYAAPAFYLETRGFLLKMSKGSTELALKRQIAQQYNLTLKSNTPNDTQILPNSISEYITKPIEWLQNRYPNEYCFQVFNILYFFDRRQTHQQLLMTFLHGKHRIDETNGLKFVQKLNVKVYQCECLFLPNLQIGNMVTVAPLSQQNLNITCGTITGQILNIQSTFTYSLTHAQAGRTVFTMLVTNQV